MKAYKYLVKKHSNSLIKEGCLRIGTLYDYHNKEEYGPEIGDDTEGSITKRMKGPITINKDNNPDFIKEAGVDLVFEGDSRIIIQDDARAHLHFEDMYIYSMSEVFNEQLMNELGYDSCVEILDLDEFLTIISAALNKQVTYRGWAKCIYNEKVIPHDRKASYEWALLKHKRYVHQREVRAIWSSINAEINPMVITVPSIIKLCKMC